VLIGRVSDGFENPDGQSPHYEILVEAVGQKFRLAINVKSMDGSDMLACYVEDFQPTGTFELDQLAQNPGFHPLEIGPAGNGLDYLRNNLFSLSAMEQVPPDGE